MDEILVLRGAAHEVIGARPAGLPVEHCLRRSVHGKARVRHRGVSSGVRAHLDVAVVPVGPKPEGRDDAGVHDIKLTACAARVRSVADLGYAIDSVDRRAHLVEPLHRPEPQGLRRTREREENIRRRGQRVQCHGDYRDHCHGEDGGSHSGNFVSQS